MSFLNYEDTELKLTLGDLVQTFTEEDLQDVLPVYLEDVSLSTKDKVAEYQKLLAAGDYEAATQYKKDNKELDTLILDSKKINSLWAYLAFAYMYAKNKRQQISISKDKPIDQEVGDFWMPYDNNSTNEILPLYVKTSDGEYKQIWVQPNLDYVSEIDINNLVSGSNMTDPNKIVNLKALDLYAKSVNQKLQDFFQSGNDFKKFVSDRIVAKNLSETPVLTKQSVYDSLISGNVMFNSTEKTFELSSLSNFSVDNDFHYVSFEVPHSYNNLIYADLTLSIVENVDKYISVFDHYEKPNEGMNQVAVYRWDYQETIQVDRTYNFDIIRTYDSKENTGKIIIRNTPKPILYGYEGSDEGENREGEEYFDQEYYLEKSASDTESMGDKFILKIGSDDEDWLNTSSNKVRPISITCRVNSIYYK